MSPDGVLASVGSHSEEMAKQESERAQTPQLSKGEEDVPTDEKGTRITPKDSQPKSKQNEPSQPSTEQKPAPSGFCLSADAPPYTPQSAAAKQATKAANIFGAAPETFDLGFIRPFNCPSGKQQQQSSQQRPGYLSVTAPLSTPSDSRMSRRAGSVTITHTETQLKSDTVRKVSLKSNTNAAASTVPLKFCKFLVGEDVAGFLVGRKGVGIEEFQSRNGPGLKVSVSKRGELFPCLLERTATAVGVGDGVERALLEVSRVALDRAMHKEEERRIDNGKKICKPKGCFKLVVPESALVHIFTPDPEGRVPMLEIAKKHGVEILSSAEGGYLHNKIHQLGLKETVLQVIGTSDTVPPAAVDLSLLYQGDPSLPSSLHLNYSHAHFVATPPPPPTPPPSPALSSKCGNRVPPHFAHPAGMLHLTSGYQPFGTSSSWSHTPQPTPLVDGLRVSVSSQAPMFCVPSTVGSLDSIPAAQVSQLECQLASQKQGFQGPTPYSLPSNGNGCIGGWQSFEDSAAPSIPSLQGERLTAELQQQLGAAIVAAAAANVSAQHQPTPNQTNSHSSLGTQQQQFHDLQQRQGPLPQPQLQHQLRASSEWPGVQLLSQLSMAHPQQTSMANEQPKTMPQQHTQRLQFHQVDELQQQFMHRQIPQARHEHSSSYIDEVNESRPSSGSRSLSLQELQQHIQALQLQHKEDKQQKDDVVHLSSFFSRTGRMNEQKQLLLSQQVQQQLQQHLQQFQPRQAQNPQQSQLHRHLQQVDLPPVQRWTAAHAISLHGEQHYPVACSDQGHGQFEQLQQFLPIRGRASSNQEAVDVANIQHLEPELLHQPPHNAAAEPLSPIPPPQWAQIQPHQLQQQMQERAHQQENARMPLVSSQNSTPGASPGLSVQLPQQHSSAIFLEAHGAINAAAQPQHPGMASSGLAKPVLEGSAPSESHQVVPSEGDICDSHAVRKLLEDLLKIMSLPTAEGAPRNHCHGQTVATLTHTTEASLDNEPSEAVEQKAQETRERMVEGMALVSSSHAKQLLQKPLNHSSQRQQLQRQEGQASTSHRRRRNAASTTNRTEPGTSRKGTKLRSKASHQVGASHS
ncbi:hypothetical protein, conserved [Eimeria brunetti]|uniref:KH domain-containing protein n=1 Tax=Eimeria brunetti TaxID=51314 RepID=U6LDT9_9EIME|nr:hypothetical protein, conserved [Eimeria brunetti]